MIHFLNEAKSKWYLNPPYGVGLIGEENFKDVKDFRPAKLYLSHGSSSQKLPNILQLGGLASIKYAKDKGVVKSTGGEMGGEGGLESRHDGATGVQTRRIPTACSMGHTDDSPRVVVNPGETRGSEADRGPLARPLQAALSSPPGGQPTGRAGSGRRVGRG